MKLGLPLQPGRRQCVGNGELPALFLDWVFQFWREYTAQGTPRFGLLNLMSAHEHFMTRLATLDDQLRSFILHIEAHLRRDSALFLLSDHGTHGIWWASPHTSAAPRGPHPPYKWLPLTRATPCGPHLSSSSLAHFRYNDFAVGQAEHRSPALFLILPASFVADNPKIDAALQRNRHRRVTAFDLHATLRHLAAWPAMPTPAEEATSLFVDLPDDRSCEMARVPAEWCVDLAPNCVLS